MPIKLRTSFDHFPEAWRKGLRHRLPVIRVQALAHPTMAILCCWLMTMPCVDMKGGESRNLLDNNLRCVDLSDLVAPLPLDVTDSFQVLRRTEGWEHNTFDRVDTDSLGYPALVKNDRGRNPDDKYYLFYAHHDPCSGIGCAVAETIQGPYRKLAATDSNRHDSLVLANPHYPILNPPVSDPSHYSTPSVIWNEQEELWFMYFHYYNHNHDAWRADKHMGYGHQMTALATCPDLSSNIWTVRKNSEVGKVSIWDIAPVLPTTEKVWMNSQSSYHAIQRLGDGQWLAFLRGTSVGQVVQLGFAVSEDGISWNYLPENPVIGGDGRKGVNRPYFVGYLGVGKSGKAEYLLVWGESPAERDDPHVIYGYTTDFVNIQRDSRGYANWKAEGDGAISPWREGNKLYLFSGKHALVMTVPGRSSEGKARHSARP